MCSSCVYIFTSIKIYTVNDNCLTSIALIAVWAREHLRLLNEIKELLKDRSSPAVDLDSSFRSDVPSEEPKLPAATKDDLINIERQLDDVKFQNYYVSYSWSFQ